MNEAIWRSVPLGDVAGATGLLVDGDWVETKDQNPEGEVRLIQLADVGIGAYLDKSNRRLTSETARRLRCTLLRENDILIARMPDPIGRACLFPGAPSPCATVVDVCIVRPDPQVAEPRYLLHFLNSAYFQASILGLIKGATRQRVSRGNLQQVGVPLPPLNEQRRIAAILDQADDLRCKRREALERANALTEAIFIDTFGDPIENVRRYPTKTLRQLVDPKRGISYGVVQRGEDQDSGVPIIRISDVVEGDIDVRYLKMTRPEVAAKFKRTLLVGGEIVISIRGTIGRCAIVPMRLAGGNVSREIAVIPTSAPELNEFYIALLRSRPAQARFTRDVKGIAQRGINLEDLWELPVIQPGEAELHAFLGNYAKVNDLVKNHRAHLAKLDALFASLQHRAFRGDL